MDQRIITLDHNINNYRQKGNGLKHFGEYFPSLSVLTPMFILFKWAG